MSMDLAGIFVAGLLTFASPCILPLVPIYIGLLGGASADVVRRGERPRLVARTVAFALGLATVFVGLGLVATAAGRLLAAHRQALLAIAGVVVIAFGFRFLGILRLPFLDRERRPWLQRLAPGLSLVGAYAFGAAFALGWTPCIGPVLGAVLTYTASTAASAARGALYLGVYSAGLALPLVAAAGFAPLVVPVLNRLKRNLRSVEIATGVLLVGAGLLLATDKLMILMPTLGPAAEQSTTVDSAVPLSPARAADAGVCTSAEGGTACAAPESTWAPPGANAATSVVHGPAVVEIMSGSCPICRRMAPVVAEAERGCPMKVVHAYVEDAAGADLARRHGVRGVPTFLVLDPSGAEVRRLVGQQPADAIRSALESVSTHMCEAVPPGPEREPKGS